MPAPDSAARGGLLDRLRTLFGRPERAPVPVIAVASLMVGGSGRVPLIRAIVRRLLAQGRAPHVVASGEGAKLRGPIRVDPLEHTSRDVGDEALRLAADAPVWVARDLRAGVRAAAEAKAEVIVIENRLRSGGVVRDLTMLAAAAEPKGDNMPLPPVSTWHDLPDGFDQAQALVLIGPGGGEPLLSLARGDDLAVLRADVLALNAIELAGRRLVAFAGIPRPDKAFRTIRDAGAELVAECPFPDHHPYTREDWEALIARAEALGAELVTTENDAVRLPADWRRRAWVMRVELQFEVEDALDALLARIIPAPAPSPA
jgi:tetraacyldisaccharide 4'-kinase